MISILVFIVWIILLVISVSFETLFLKMSFNNKLNVSFYVSFFLVNFGPGVSVTSSS